MGVDTLPRGDRYARLKEMLRAWDFSGQPRVQIRVVDRISAPLVLDPEFKARLLANGRAACEEMGITFCDDTLLAVRENTETVHNLVVCTLCSCYPRPVLGLPPGRPDLQNPLSGR